jgi:uncharacterized protein (TIGR04255 family)
VAFVFKGTPEVLMDPTLPGRFMSEEAVQRAYPKRPTPQAHRVRMGSVELEMNGDFNPIRFESEEGAHILLLRPGMLSVHALKDYTRWADFKPRVMEAVRAYMASTGLREVVRIGVRYVNAWVVPDLGALESHLCGVGDTSCLQRALSFEPAGLHRQQEYRTSTHSGVVVHQGCAPCEGGWEASLDIDAGEHVNGLTVEELQERVDALHELVYQVFEASITPEARKAFQ